VEDHVEDHLGDDLVEHRRRRFVQQRRRFEDEHLNCEQDHMDVPNHLQHENEIGPPQFHEPAAMKTPFSLKQSQS